MPVEKAFDDHPAPLLRKEFVVGKKIARARAYISGLGYYELRLNGKRLGDHVLDPGWTDYSKRVFYSTYDVTEQLKRGNNAIGIMLGNGWFNPLPLPMWGRVLPGAALTTGQPRAILQLVIEFTDGTAQRVLTDETWRANGGPILRNSVYLGEVYDARREQPGWDTAGFDESKVFAAAARILGNTSDAAEAESQAERVKTAFNRRFLKPGTGRYDTGTQACQAFALYMGFVPDEEKEQALDVLVQDIMVTRKGHLSTGIFGTKYMLNVLTDLGRPEVAYTLVNQRTFPGWGYMLDKGATTLWEHWDFSDNTYSHNHPMFGSVSEWFYKGLAGITPAPDASGFDKIIIAPQPVGDLKWVKASYDSVRGRIVSEWERKGSEFKLRVRVPVGASAKVFIPAQDTAGIRESGKPLERARGVRVLGTTTGKAILAVDSGDYHFNSALGTAN